MNLGSFFCPNLNMKRYLTSEELAERAREILRSEKMTPEEHFQFLVDQGIIDEEGRVLVCKLFGDDEPDPTPPANGQVRDRSKS